MSITTEHTKTKGVNKSSLWTVDIVGCEKTKQSDIIKSAATQLPLSSVVPPELFEVTHSFLPERI